jgi:hypothetical protein
MNPSANDKIYESELAIFWFNEEGMLCANGKNVLRTLENQKRTYECIKQISGNKKVCLLSDATSSSAQTKEVREYIAGEMPNLFKAMAVISRSSMGRFITNVFLSVNRYPVPIKMFDNEASAREWLRQYL